MAIPLPTGLANLAKNGAVQKKHAGNLFSINIIKRNSHHCHRDVA